MTLKMYQQSRLYQQANTANITINGKGLNAFFLDWEEGRGVHSCHF